LSFEGKKYNEHCYPLQKKVKFGLNRNSTNYLNQTTMPNLFNNRVNDTASNAQITAVKAAIDELRTKD